MSGRLAIIGLGPGDASQRTPEATAALEEATDLVGYGPYLDRLSYRAEQRLHPSDNRVEVQRAQYALKLAAAGHSVAVVSSGDSGVFGMASAVFEALDHGDPSWRGLDIRVIPGVSAMFAAAARLGAPLGHDFCAISLSDNLKPWPTVASRLTAAAGAGFVIAIYNPRSRARPWQLAAAFDLLRTLLPATTPVGFATAIGQPRERLTLTTLIAADPGLADMQTLVLIGTEGTRLIERPGQTPWVYASRRQATA